MTGPRRPGQTGIPRIVHPLVQIILCVLLVMPLQPELATADVEPAFRVLVFSKTNGFRHPSISDGIALIEALGEERGFAVDATEDASAFTAANLADYAVVVWLNTTGNVLDSTQQSAFRNFVESGGGWVGVHSATDTEYDWPWYGILIGGDAWFATHPAIAQAAVAVEVAGHVSSQHLPAQFTVTDEWYDFQNNPRPAVQVLLTVDEASYDGGGMGSDHPIAWYHGVGSGRAWYTNLGHRPETYQDSSFQSHLLGGIEWAARQAPPRSVGPAEYELEFEGLWSPDDSILEFPGDAHFTTLIGATHDAGDALWARAELASPGIEKVAEVGSVSTLSAEIDDRIEDDRAGSEIRVAGHNSFPRRSSTRLEVDANHPEISLISMVAPSPDWFVGVSGLALLDPNGWSPGLTMDLTPHDAGTEFGATFSLGNDPTEPPRVIDRRGTPFVQAAVIGRLHFTRIPEPGSTGSGTAALFTLASLAGWNRRSARRGFRLPTRRRSTAGQ
jgi:type 1 glutamine amidotransferase